MTRRSLGVLTIGLALMLPLAGSAGADSVGHFPSTDQPWSARHYVDFYFAHYNGNRALPHLRTATTARVFERLVSRDNIARILADPAPKEQKRQLLGVILATLGEIRAAYNYAVFVGEPLQEELARIQAFTLFVMDSAVALAEPRPDCSACTTALGGVVESLSARDTFSKGQILALSEALQVHYPGISPVLSPRQRRELRAQVSRLAAVERDPALRESHRKLLGTFAHD
jgi:hypothetical protein